MSLYRAVIEKVQFAQQISISVLDHPKNEALNLYISRVVPNLAPTVTSRFRGAYPFFTSIFYCISFIQKANKVKTFQDANRSLFPLAQSML